MTNEKLPATKTEVLTPEQIAQIDNAVQFINEKANEMLYKGSEEIGEYLLKNFFKDDPKLASSKNPHKTVSYRELCKREDLSLHPITLGIMVRVAAQERFFKTKKVDTSKLTYTHKAQLVKLEDGDKKIALLKNAVSKNLSTRDFAKQITAARKEISGVIKSQTFEIKDFIMDLGKLIDDSMIDSISIEKEKLHKLSAKMRNQLRDKAIDIKDDLDKKIKKLTSICGNFISVIDEVAKEKEEKKPLRGRKAKKS